MGNTFESRGGNGQVIEVDMGPIPENPSNASDKDIKALEKYHNHHPDQFPSSKYIDVRGWKNWRNISKRYNKDDKKWTVSYRGFFKDEEVVQEFDNEEEAQQELDKLQEYNKKIALDLIREARNFAIGEDLEAPWTDSVDISAETLTPGEDTTPTDSVPERLADDGRVSEYPTPVEYLEVDQDPKGDEVSKDKLPGAEALQAALDSLINEGIEKENNKVTEEGGKYTGEPDIETNRNALELDISRKRAQEAINKYQLFHQSFPKESRTPEIQEQYRRLEKEAWDRVRELAYKLGGNISQELPQLRNILESHRDLKDSKNAKEYLLQQGNILVNEKGNITHIVDYQNNVVELNRPRTFEEIFDQSRPVHILYRTNEEGKKIGYVVESLNENTITWIETTLSGNTIPRAEIKDETGQSTSLKTEAVATQENNLETLKQSEERETTPQVSLDVLRLAYAKAEESWNRKRGDEDLEDAFMVAREAYNTELERVLKLQVAEGQADNISKMFKDEVMSLRDSRIEQSQELQGKWEKRFNNAKEKFLGWATQNKTRWMLANISLFAAGALLSWTGAGIPVSGALEMTRRSLGSVMSGVSSRNTLVGLMEDGEINRFGIKFKAVIPKLVDESLKDDYINNASDDDLRTKLSTLEAYYRLNGGEFTKENQQQAYEKVLTELARRVQKNVIDAEQNQDELQSDWQEQKPENLTEEDLKKSNRERYTSELLNTISDTRIAELDKFRRKRKIANVVGFATTGVLGGVLLNDMVKPGSMFRPDMEGGGKPHIIGGSTPDTQGPGADLGTAEAPPAPELPPIEEAVQQAEQSSEVVGSGAQEAAAAAEQAQELARDVSSLDSGETIWGEITKQLGENASQSQIQQAVENYLQSQAGQESIFELAKQTEGGREFLARWSIDNADAMAKLELKDLYEVSRYLGEGELKGLTELSLDNLDALEQAVAPEVTRAPTVEPGSTEPPAPPAAEAPVPPPAPEVPPVASTEFTRGVSEALGTTNLTESQLQEAIYSFATSEQGGADLYKQIISNEEGARFLSGFGVNNAADFANLRPDEVYEIAQTVGVENLDKLPGFELNDIILSKFEDAPDIVELVKGSKPLDMVNRYIANEIGNLPYDSSLGQQVLNTYLETPQGKQWLYDAIINNPDKLNGNQNIQFVEEYFRQKGIKSGVDINWLDLTQDRRFPTSIFWRETALAGGRRIPPLSTLLQPSQMPGIKEAVRQVLTR